MSYKEWIENLFEQTYPKNVFKGLTLIWVSDQEIKCEWDNRSYTIRPERYYPDKHSNNPVEDIYQGILRFLPATESELHSTPYHFYHSDTLAMKSVIIRDAGRTLRWEAHNSFPEYTEEQLELLKNELKCDIHDLLLVIEHSDDRINPLVFLNTEEQFNYLFNEYIDYDDNLMFFHDSQNGKLFLGHSNPILRLECTTNAENKAQNLKKWHHEIQEVLVNE